MWGEWATSILVAAAGLAPANALAVSAPGPHEQHPCTVVGAEKLPVEAGGAEAICAAIVHAVAVRAPNVHFTAEVKVLKPSMLATRLTVNGRALAEQRFAVMDSNLSTSSIERFAQSIAAAVAKAVKA